MTFYILLFLTGLLGGFIGGLIGVGGGIIFIIILPQALTHLGVQPAELAQYQIANSLVAMMAASFSANYTHIKGKNFWPKQIVSISVTAMLTGLLTQYYIVNTPYYDKTTFNIIILILLGYMVLRTIMFARSPGTAQPGDIPAYKLSLVGLVSGVVTSLSGLGGGIIIIPLLNTVFKLPVTAAQSISMGTIGIMATAVSIGNVFAHPAGPHIAGSYGYIVLPVALPLAFGVALTSSLGVTTSKKLPSHVISYTFSAFIMLTILKTIWELVK
ncbi:MAG: sulfite exporter TauE/SafE family protein [Bacteroidota bacterium]